MLRLKALSLVIMTALWWPVLGDALDDHNMAQLRAQLKVTFGEPEDIFSKALRNLPDFEATQSQIESVIGPHYSTVHKEWEEVRTIGINLVIGPMKRYQEIYTETKPMAAKVFGDYYDLIRAELNPQTIELNKDLYIIYEYVDAESLSEVVTKLGEFYERWAPLQKLIDEEKEEMMSRIKRLTLQKRPNYVPTKIEAFPNVVSESLEPTSPDIKVRPPLVPKIDPFKKVKVQMVLELENADVKEIKPLEKIGSAASRLSTLALALVAIAWLGFK